MSRETKVQEILEKTDYLNELLNHYDRELVYEKLIDLPSDELDEYLESLDLIKNMVT